MYKDIRFKLLAITFVMFHVSFLISSMPHEWQLFQRELSIQAANFRHSPEHIAYRQNKNIRTYNVGDSQTFWRWNLSVMPPTWIQTPATCRAVGQYCYIFVADNQWNVNMTQAHVDTILVRLEQNTPNNPNLGAIQMDINLFGEIPDELDNDPKLIVFYSALGSFQGTAFDGYFSPYNQVTEAQAQQMNPPGHSNECEMIYMTCSPLNPVAPIRMSVLAHELQHLIHWGQDANEETWLNEGCSELAMVAYGIPDPITGFNSNPDNNLTSWTQSTADYVKVMLFFTYLQEHFNQTGLIRDLVADPMNGLESLNNQLGEYFPLLSVGQLLHWWTIANVLDSPILNGGLFNYQQLNLPAFSMINVNALPNQSGLTIQPYAADYLSFNAALNHILLSVQTNNPVYISELVYNSSNQCIAVNNYGVTNTIQINTADQNVYRVVIVITNHNSSSLSYSYSSSFVGNNEELSASPLFNMSCYPNPFYKNNNTLQITVSGLDEKDSFCWIYIYNIKGQIVRKLSLQKDKIKGNWQTNWDTTSNQNTPVSNGIYLLHFANSHRKLNKFVSVFR